MHIAEVITVIIFGQFKPLSGLADYIFHFFRLTCLRGSNSQYLVYLCGVVSYIYVLKTQRHGFRDDVVLAVSNCVCAYTALSVVCRQYTDYILRLIYAIHCRAQACGKLRTCLYIVSLVLVAALLSFLAVGGVSFASSTFTEHLMWRVDDNVIQIAEDRTHFQDLLVHPATEGKKRPFFLSKLYRYPLEDVQMSCEFSKMWLSNAHPTEYQVVWRKNGVPVAMTDRHKHQLSVTEVVKNESSTNYLRSRGASYYEVKTTLTIQLLRESDFGSYTCHWSKHMNISLHDFLTNSAKLRSENEKARKKYGAKQQETKAPSPESQRQNQVDRKRLFQDEFLHMEEFRLVKIRQRQEIIRAPASAILHFTTSYWHLSAKGDVEVDYSVNAQSYHSLCQDSYFHGCSKALLLYWLFWHVDGERFGVPPLQLFTIWGSAEFPAERYRLVHCLCENAYGYHNTKYLRRYYNTTTQQFELVEVLHPHVLVVVPREQNMLNLFKNRSQCSPVIEQPACERPPSICKASWDFQTIKDFAEAVVTYYHHFELAVIAAILVALIFSLRRFALVLEFTGRHIRRLTLEGSMGYLTTAGRMDSNSEPQNTASETPDLQVNEIQYDLFLSYAEAQQETKIIHDYVLPVLEGCGFRVCLRDRDLAPNLTEILALSRAIQNSHRFLIFLSAAYFEDHFRKDFEAAMIIEAVCDRRHSASSILLIKLDPCQAPPWLSHLDLHDWTTSALTQGDHFLRLLKWLEPAERWQMLRSNLDIFMTFLPLLISGVIWVISVSWSVQLIALLF